MGLRERVATGSVVALLSSLTPLVGAQEVTPAPADDAVVVAIIDSGIGPYHWDFLASMMPQHQDEDAGNDLPLASPPDTWLPGFPDTSSFEDYRPLQLSLDDSNEKQRITTLARADREDWSSVETSTPDSPNYYWFPDTKVVGALTFEDGGTIHAGKGATPNPGAEHGQGTSSVAVGNLHGGCPECLLVFVQYGGDTAAESKASGERAIEWAMSQPWIDVVSNSYGFSTTNQVRDRVYSDSDTEAQRSASERGQTVFFSAGNGIQNDFRIPNSTLFSSQEGPDWIVTVGAVEPASGASYSGHGKPADVAGVGNGYPSAYRSQTVGGEGTFGGTSNATPEVAGLYARALLRAREVLPGPSRIQQDGMIASTTGAGGCAAERPDCELADGLLTAAELRTRLFHGAIHTPAGMKYGNDGQPPGGTRIEKIGEDEFLNEGHGTYFGRAQGAATFAAELERIVAPMEGRAAPLTRPAAERPWMIVDSYCRQELWGDWAGGYFTRGQTTLPGPDANFPIRTSIEQVCPHLFPPV